MIILDVEQGKPEWFAARVGIPSASMFSEIITSTGGISKSREKLIFQLAGERVTGIREETYTSADMKWGTEHEPEARALFELLTGRDVVEIGMCYPDENRFYSCSPDGLVDGIDGDEGLEIKCPKLTTQVSRILTKLNTLPTSYVAQVQGSLAITGKKRWHWLSYYPGLKPIHIIVERNEIWIAKFTKAMNDFITELDETHKLLIEEDK